MAQPYTQRLVFASLSSGDQLLYTCPSDRTVVVRDFVVINTSGAIVTFNIYVAAPGGNYSLLYHPVPIGETYHLELRQAISAGDAIRGNLLGAGPGGIVITGYVLSTAPRAA